LPQQIAVKKAGADDLKSGLKRYEDMLKQP
jgi:hypothetical protein